MQDSGQAQNHQSFLNGEIEIYVDILSDPQVEKRRSSHTRPFCGRSGSSQKLSECDLLLEA